MKIPSFGANEISVADNVHYLIPASAAQFENICLQMVAGILAEFFKLWDWDYGILRLRSKM